MGKIDKTSFRGPLPVRLIQNTTCALLFLVISCVTASAVFIGVEFDAQITGSNIEGWPVGKRMIGYFVYDSSLPPGQQTNSRPMLVFGEPGAMNEFWWYDFTVYNNRVFENYPFNPFTLDGIVLRFPFMCCSPTRYGHLFLTSTNTSLFTSDSLPQTIPPLEQFDRNRGISLLVEETQPYGTVSIQIQRLSMVPGSGLGQPVAYDIKRAQAGVSFRFLTEPLTNYRVEFTDHLVNVDWQTLTNIPAPRDAIVTVHDVGQHQRFYRIRKNPN
jgi:hypothetical protein